MIVIPIWHVTLVYAIYELFQVEITVLFFLNCPICLLCEREAYGCLLDNVKGIILSLKITLSPHNSSRDYSLQMRRESRSE